MERGIISAEVAQTLDDVRALDLLFEPGFSLAEKVTDVSGRGVGMDVVRSCIRGLHGTVTLTSRPGEGTRLSIKLPTSLMVSRGMMVEAGGGEYLLPVANIRELIKVPASAVRWYRQQALANIHGHLVPLVFLSAIVNESSQPASAAKELSIAVLDSHGTSYGVVVDRFGGETEALIKPLDARLEGVKLFLGATIMGDGRLMLVINPNGLALELVHERAA